MISVRSTLLLGLLVFLGACNQPDYYRVYEDPDMGTSSKSFDTDTLKDLSCMPYAIPIDGIDMGTNYMACANDWSVGKEGDSMRLRFGPQAADKSVCPTMLADAVEFRCSFACPVKLPPGQTLLSPIYVDINEAYTPPEKAGISRRIISAICPDKIDRAWSTGNAHAGYPASSGFPPAGEVFIPCLPEQLIFTYVVGKGCNLQPTGGEWRVKVTLRGN